MSVLRNRIMRHDAGQGPAAATHPWGTEATPMEMPMMTVAYGGDWQAVYGTAQPLVTADGAVITGQSDRAVSAPHVGLVMPAGRP